METATHLPASIPQSQYAPIWKFAFLKSIYRCIPLLLIILPFFYYLWFMLNHLIVVEYPDAFAYLWRRSINFYFFTGRSLTQRIIFSLLRDDIKLIPFAQLAFYLLTAITLYFLVTYKKSFIFKLLCSAFISYVFSSYTLNITSVIINSEPIFICLLIIYPCWLFLYKSQGRYISILILSILFICSKNIAPYYSIFITLMWFLTTAKQNLNKKNVIFFGFIIFIAVCRIQITNHYDSSIHVNLLNNIFNRVFTSEEKSAYFHAHYGMPAGDIVKTCQGSWVMEQCLGYRPLTINQQTRNYDLIEDTTGLVWWVKTTGPSSYLHYLLFSNPVNTLAEYNAGFNKLSSEKTIGFMIDYLGVGIPDNYPNNLTTLDLLDQKIGFFGFDSLSIIHTALGIVGFNYLLIVFGYGFLGLIISHYSQRSTYMPLAGSLLLSALFLFFISYFGDGIEYARHTFPSFLILTIGGIFYFGAILEILISYRKINSAIT